MKSIAQKLSIWWMNLKYRVLLPVYWRGGGRIVEAAEDGSYLKARLPFGYLTRGFFGTHAGGAMYAVVDPLYVFLLARRLGPEYMVWDTSAEIEYLKAGTEDLYAEFHVSAAETAEIRRLCAERKKCRRNYQVELKTTSGAVYARITKHIYVRKTSARLQRRMAA